MYSKYFIFKEIPIIRILLILLLGNVLGINLDNEFLLIPSIILSVIGIVLILVIRVNFSSLKLKYQTKRISTLSFIILLLLAYCLTVSNKQKNGKNHFSSYLSNEKDILYQVQLLEPIVVKEKTIKVLAKVNKIIDCNQVINSNGKIIVYLEKDSLSKKLEYGEILILKASPQEIAQTQNPYEFNYKSYLAFHNIYHSTYIPSHNWIKTDAIKRNFFLYPIYKLRSHLEFVILRYINGEKEQGIANAILIGKKDHLDQDTIKAYSSSGAMHVLAVSGLHVGIVYLVISYLLSFLNATRLKKYKPLVIILFIWFYAFLTGGSPSVLRAATMFTFIAFGKSLEQHINIYNMIAASAIILILVNPYITTEVGFQLSYLAVLGIILLQKKIYNLYIPKYWIVTQIWTLTSVSIAAQLATFPLGLLYFHQFPNFFLVSNLIVIPAAIIIVYLGVTLMALSFIPFLAKILGIILSYVIKFLNSCIYFIDQLPYSLSAEIHISLLECYLIYFVILSSCIAIIYRKKLFLKLALVAVLGLIISYYTNSVFLSKEKEFLVYHTPKNSAIEFRNGSAIYSLFDSQLKLNESLMLFRVKHNWWAKKYKSQSYIETIDQIQLIHFENRNFLLVDSLFQYPNKIINVDYIVIKNQRKLNLKEFSSKFIAENYIFDCSNSNYSIIYWEKECDELNLNCYFVGNSKAYIEKW